MQTGDPFYIISSQKEDANDLFRIKTCAIGQQYALFEPGVGESPIFGTTTLTSLYPLLPIAQKISNLKQSPVSILKCSQRYVVINL